jgi:hypothetical protein
MIQSIQRCVNSENRSLSFPFCDAISQEQAREEAPHYDGQKFNMRIVCLFCTGNGTGVGLLQLRGLEL